MLVPSQCNIFHFRNLVKRCLVKSDEDLRLIIRIRRANLDTYWAREEGTVSATRRVGVEAVLGWERDGVIKNTSQDGTLSFGRYVRCVFGCINIEEVVG